MPDVLDHLGKDDPKGRTLALGLISRVSGDTVSARIPSFNTSHEFGPMVFEHAADALVGDSVLIGFDEQGSPWVAGWAGTVSIPGASGPAGGDLAGTYPNPTIKANVGLTGTPTAPTAAVDANTTQIATTAWYQGQVAVGAPPDLATFSGAGSANRWARSDHVHRLPFGKRIEDTRATEELPYVDNDHKQVARVEFKSRASITGTPGSGSFGILVTYAGWTDDSGGSVKQVWYDDSTPVRVFVRRGKITGGWDAWQEMAFTSALAAYETTAHASSTYDTLANAALKAPLASPAFTGNPTAPTPAAGDNDTSIATTAFVRGELPTAQVLQPNASPTLTTTFADFGTNTMTLADAGTYLVLGTIDFNITANGVGVCIGELNVNGFDQGVEILLQNTGAATGDRATVSQNWVITVGAGAVLKFRVRKSINAGTASALNSHSRIVAVKLS